MASSINRVLPCCALHTSQRTGKYAWNVQDCAFYVKRTAHEKCDSRLFVISAAQCRAARALLGWSREELASAADVGLRTIVDFERGARDPHQATLAALERAFEIAGVTTDLTQGAGGGVRFLEADR